jgi:hypothetical protein
MVVLVPVVYGGPGRARWRDAAWAGSVAGAGLLLWWGRNLWVAGSAMGRGLALRAVPWDSLSQGLATLVYWVWPTWVPVRLALALAAVGLGVVLVRVRTPRNPPSPGCVGVSEPTRRVVGLLAMLAVCYGCVLLGTVLFLDAHTPLDDRIPGSAWFCWVARCTWWGFTRAMRRRS